MTAGSPTRSYDLVQIGTLAFLFVSNFQLLAVLIESEINAVMYMYNRAQLPNEYILRSCVSVPIYARTFSALFSVG